MSILGGRRKQKVIFNPRVNTTWSQDANKFGQKMLERMGWKSGQGLGKKEDGITDSVRVSYKNDNQGLGFKEISEGSVQQDNFNMFLESLNKSLEGETVGTSDNDVQLNSLEKKSERSRVRVHYRKVTRGKDISQYSEKDLANIFCKKSFKTLYENMQQKMEPEIYGGHMDSYFKNKMEKKKQSKLSGNNDSTNLESFCDESVPKKRRKNNFQRDQTSGVVNPGFEPLGNNETKKKKKPFATIEKSNPAFEPLENNIPVMKEVLDTIEDGSMHNIRNQVNINEEEVEENSYEVKRKKKKKKKKIFSDDQLNGLNLGSDTKSNKPIGIDNPLLSLDDSLVSVNTDKSQDFEVKRKKHKKASKLGVDNVALNLSNANLSLQSMENIKSPMNGIENCAFALKSVLTPQGTNKLKRRKSVRFSEKNEEFLIPNRNAQEVLEKNELYEINAVVIENGLEEMRGIVNNGFDIKSKKQTNVDSIHTCKLGIDNQAYDARNQTVEEAIQSLTDTIDQYQAEVENGINESKAKKRKRKSL